jgi:hypothetical protein
VLKASLGLAFLVLAVASIAAAAAGKPFSESLGALSRYPNVALMVFAWITLVFFASGVLWRQVPRERALGPAQAAAAGKD